MQSNKLLKISGILMIIGGSISLIIGIFVGLFTVLAAVAVGQAAGILVFATVLILVGAVITFVAGILGVKNAAKPEKAGSCIVFGILAVLMCIISSILTLVGGGNFDALSLISGLVLPIIYLIGAFQSKKAA